MKEKIKVTAEESKYNPTYWDKLNLIEKLSIANHNNHIMDNTTPNKEGFYVGAFVKCKNNGIIRYVTSENKRSTKLFKDDGKISEAKPSHVCCYDDYVMI